MAEKKTIELEVTSNLGSLKDQLSEAKKSVQELADKFGSSSKEVANAADTVRLLEKEIKQTNSTLKSIGIEGKFNAITGSITGTLSGLQAIQGSFALVGAESNNVDEALLKVQSAMALTDGIEGVFQAQKSFQKLSALIKATTVFQKISAAAQYVWNAAMAANPIGAVVVAISALLFTGYKLIKFFKDSSEANESAANATKKNTNALKEQSINASQSVNKLKIYNDQQYALAQAAGMSSEELRKLAIKHKDEEVALNKKNAVLAQGTFLRERDTLASLKNSNASDEVIANQEKLTQETYKNFTKQNEILDKSYKERASLRNANAVGEVSDAKANADKVAEAQKKAKEAAIEKEKELEKERQELIRSQGEGARERYEAGEKLIADAKKANEDALKTENQIKTEKENADFELKKQDLLSKGLAIEEIEKQHKINLANLNNDYFANEATNNIKSTADAKAAADSQNQTEQAKFDLKINLLNQTASAIGGLGSLFKKGTAAAKAAALAEIAIGSAAGLINGLDIAQKSAKGTGPAAAFAFPLFYATQVAAVFGAVSRAKGIISGGGSGGGSAPSMGGGGGSTAPAPAAPAFNVVGASATNQLAQTIGNKEQQPLKAYVVAGDITTAQSLEKNIIQAASIG